MELKHRRRPAECEEGQDADRPPKKARAQEPQGASARESTSASKTDTAGSDDAAGSRSQKKKADKVFLDITIGGTPAGRIVIKLKTNVVPKVRYAWTCATITTC